jgi:putative CocE/NonD family hydrolase
MRDPTSLDGVLMQPDVGVDMRDGVRLATDVYLPAAGGPWPALVARTPYGRRGALRAPYAHPAWYARRGFAVVWQDTRGRGESEGSFEPFVAEAADGRDTIEWAAAQPWCTGRVGTFGYSYAGATQVLPAALDPAPHHAAMVPAMTGPPREWMFRGRTFNLAFALGWAAGLGVDQARRAGDLAAYDRFDWLGANRSELFRVLPVRDALPPKLLEHVPFVREWLDGVAGWAPPDPRPAYERVAVPGLHVAGWYDFFLEGTVAAFTSMAAAGRAEQRLVVGPWWHMPWSRYLGATDFGPDAEHVIDELQAAFFRRHLLDDAAALDDQPPVRLFVLGRDRWRGDDAWPPEGSRQVVMHLRSAGRANSLAGDGSLTGAPPETGEPADVSVSDPSVPVLSLGGRGCCLAGASPMGPADQRPQEIRGDVLIYDTGPLDDELLVVGTPAVVVHVASDAPTFDVVARLVDVHPDGRAINVTDGQVRVSAGETRPGDAAPVEVAMAPTAAAFARGHRLRLEVTWSSFPMYDRNPQSAVPATAATPLDFRVATQVLYHDTSRPSRLALPVPPS